MALGLSSRHDDTDSPVMIWLQKTKGEKKILTRHTEGMAGAADGMRSLPWVEESLFGSMKLRKAATGRPGACSLMSKTVISPRYLESEETTPCITTA